MRGCRNLLICNRNKPSVSILIPVLNESRSIKKCLESIYSSTYPKEKYEVLVIDGCSSDNTIRIVQTYQKIYKNLLILTNPHQTVPYALNIGISKSNGKIIMWFCGHAEYSQDYIEKSIELLLEKSAASVGGLVIPKGVGFVGRAVASAMKTPLGNGNAIYRTGTKAGWVDTVMGGCWLRSSVEKVGGFDESWTRNQDSKFNILLKQKVGKIYFDPSIHCYHYVRETLCELGKQYFQYGFWRFRTLKHHPESFAIRQIICPGLLVTLVFAAMVNNTLFLFLVLGYLSLLLCFSFAGPNVDSVLERFIRPAIYLIIHFSWGGGFLWAAFHPRQGNPK